MLQEKCFFIALSLYPLSFFANTPFNKNDWIIPSSCLFYLRVTLCIVYDNFELFSYVSSIKLFSMEAIGSPTMEI